MLRFYIRILSRVIAELDQERRNALGRIADDCLRIAAVAKERSAHVEIAYDHALGCPSLFQFGPVPSVPRYTRIAEATPKGDLIFDAQFGQAVLA